MKSFKIIAIIIAVLVLILVVLGLIAPKEVKFSRNTQIDAPNSLIVDQLRFYENFENWSPWAELDPDMTVRIEGEDGLLVLNITGKEMRMLARGKWNCFLTHRTKLNSELLFTEGERCIPIQLFILKTKMAFLM